MTDVVLGCAWHPSKVSFERLAEQIVTFSQKLQQIDPIFAELALVGDDDTRESWLRMPLVQDVSFDHWVQLFSESPSVVDVYCWNRRDPGDGFCKFTIHANDTVIGNGVAINNVPPELHRPEPLTGILGALIETFDGDQADVYTALDIREPIWARHWRLWLREGIPWPGEPGSMWPPTPDNRFKREQGVHGSAEPWLAGTLYTWPEYEPWNYKGSSAA